MSISLTIAGTYKAVQALEAKGHSKSMAEGIVEAVQSAKLSLDPASEADVARVERQVEQLRSEMYRALLIHGLLMVTAILGAALVLANALGVEA